MERSDGSDFGNDGGNDGDERWFRDVFETTYGDLVAYARRRAAGAAEADDVVAEVYAIAWRRRADLDRSRAARPWLYGIAANVLRNQRREGTRRLQLVDRLESQPDPRSTGDPSDRPGGELRAALARLSPDDQEVLRLVAWEGLSHDEAGQALGCTANAVGIRIHRARRRLQAELDQADASIETGLVAPTDRPAPIPPNDDERRGGATT